MNIEEAKEEIKKISYNTGTFLTNYEVNLEKVLQILEKIDQTKVEVPKDIFEYIKQCKSENVPLSLAYDVRANSYLASYLYDETPDNIEKFAKAWLAYPNIEVEKEKRYTVEIPDPNGPNVTVTLIRVINGVGICFTTNSEWVEQEEFQLTESEIRKDFDWAWQWAEEVTK